MEIQQLTTFVKAAELLSFSKTADILGYSQSAVTIQIKQLESELQVKLFDRIGKRVTLTNEGVTFQKYALNILSTINEAQLVLSNSAIPQGTLRIGASESLCTYILPSILADYHKSYPNVILSLKTGNISELFDLLKQNQVDIICLFAEKAALTEHKLLFEKPEPFVFLASPSHPLSKTSSISLNALENENFLLTEAGCSYRHTLEHLFLEHHLTLHPLLEMGNTEAIKRCCIQGLGIALLPYFTAAHECTKKELHILNTVPLKISLYHQLICHKQKYLSAALKAFITLYTDSFTG